ncbi:20593_t:CDS:2 [Funneliformis geosporum]|uniref:11950_t:CDS:1 n=1 Tax=Funneliformis geosporum TaxID=1117311 RepID=A0A9W4WSG0_9GLOM|nr:20593_t:CDS:2 [Funneliformis geosporum]CAI2168785.1 11950_t:CDS:2 [Funneliformis geosporum]
MDDDPWDDWETAADAGLDPKPSKAVDEHEKNKQLWQEANAFAQPEIIRVDTARTEYVPQLRILKRPKNPGPTTTTHPSHLASYATFAGDSYTFSNSSIDLSPKQKSLAEREAEYNLARQKIFGANTNSDGSCGEEGVITSEGKENEGQKKILTERGDVTKEVHVDISKLNGTRQKETLKFK